MDVRMVLAYLMASGFTMYKNRPVLKLIIRHFIGINVVFEIKNILLQIAEIKFSVIQLCVKWLSVSVYFELLIKIEQFSLIYGYF